MKIFKGIILLLLISTVVNSVTEQKDAVKSVLKSGTQSAKKARTKIHKTYREFLKCNCDCPEVKRLLKEMDEVSAEISKIASLIESESAKDTYGMTRK